MRSYSETNVFSSKELDLLQKAIYLVAEIPDMTPILRCHEVARIIGSLLNLQVQDGHYGPVEHSWLWMKPWKNGKYPPNILDVYSVGSLPQVKLVNFSTILPDDNAYKPGPVRDDIRQNVVSDIISSLHPCTLADFRIRVL